MPPVVAAVGAAATWFAAQHIAVQFAIRIAAGFVISMAASKLLTKQPAPTTVSLARGRQDSLRQAMAVRRTVYGETLVGGTIVYVETGNGGGGETNKYMSVLTARAAHEIGGYEEYMFGDERLTVSGNDVGGRFASRAWVYPHLGTSTQAADAQMLAYTAGGWTANHRLRGITYEHFLLKWSNDADPSKNVWSDFSISEVRARIRGKVVTDTRDSISRYSCNPALLIRDYMVSKLGVSTSEMNDTTVSAAANVCDEQVSLTNTTQTFTASASTDILTLTDKLENLRRGNAVRVSNSGGALPTGLAAATDYYIVPVGELTYKLATSFANSMAGTTIDITGDGSGVQTLTLRSEPRYTAHGIVDDSDQPSDVLAKLCATMAGVIVYSAGTFEVHAGAAGTSVMTLDEDDLRGPIEINARRSRQDIFNSVKATYIDPDQGYQPVTAPVVTNATYVSNDNGATITATLDLPFCDSATRAQRLAKIELERCRQQITLTFPAKFVAVKLKAWDIVAITYARAGWTAKEFRVVDWGLNSDGGVDLTLAEEASSMWTWSAEETAVDPAPDTNLPNARTVTAPPVPITVTEELRATATGTATTVLTASITASQDQFTARYRWRYKRTADLNYIALPSSGTNVEIYGVEDETPYTIEVAGENWLGVVSDYIAKAFTPVGQSAPPADVSGFSVNFIDGDAQLTWTANTEVDLAGYQVRFSTVTSPTPAWSAAIDVVFVAKPATSKSVPAMIGTYLIKAQDYRGNRSTVATAISSTVAAVRRLNVIQTITESTAFAGTKSDTVTTTEGTLILGTSALFDSGTGNFDDAAGLFDGGQGTIATSGTYTFGVSGVGYFDLGAVYTSRVTIAIVSSSEEQVNTFDGAVGDFDDHPGLFDGENPDNVSVYCEIATTNDNPGGSPTWSGWRPFFVGDYRCRAMKFRLTLTSEQGTMTPVVSALSVVVDMEDRDLAVAGVSAAAGGQAVTFASAFKAVPAVGITGRDMATGDYWNFTVAPTVSGFTIRFYNSGGTGVARTFDYHARGYGAQV